MHNENVNMLAHYRYSTHICYVYQCHNSGNIHCIKYNNKVLNWEYFDKDQIEDCKEYMIKDIPNESWGFVED